MWPVAPTGWPSLNTFSVATAPVTAGTGATNAGGAFVSPGRMTAGASGPGVAVGAPSTTSGPWTALVSCGWAGKSTTGCDEAPAPAAAAATTIVFCNYTATTEKT